MSPERRQRVAILIIAAAVLLMLLWGWQRLDSSHDSARRAAQELAECERLAARIAQLSDRPGAGSDQAVVAGAGTDLARSIEQLAPQCSMPADAVVRIVPEAARRVEGTAYREERTSVALRSVNVAQVVRLLHAMSRSNPALTAEGLLLSAGPAEEAAGTWNVEIRFVHSVYAPSASPASSSGI
jgi:hypothetical protein